MGVMVVEWGERRVDEEDLEVSDGVMVVEWGLFCFVAGVEREARDENYW